MATLQDLTHEEKVEVAYELLGVPEDKIYFLKNCHRSRLDQLKGMSPLEIHDILIKEKLDVKPKPLFD